MEFRLGVDHGRSTVDPPPVLESRCSAPAKWNTKVERWRTSIENYIPHVTPGLAKAMTSAPTPSGDYLLLAHDRIHHMFRDVYLGRLEQLPKDHLLSRPELATRLEIVLESATGCVIQLGVVKTSGVTAFDIGVLESVANAAPFGAAPQSIRSPDGNVYLYWEFHRDPTFACSTYFAAAHVLGAR
jgi:hypothetical protein